jgi:TonB-linked SusC/RagA family outer membrane protein
MLSTAHLTLLRRTALTLGLLVASAGYLSAQGVVVGRVTDQASGNALVGARIVVVGTALTTLTNADGRYRLTGVPTGTVQLRASQIGYASSTRSVSVSGDQATEDFALVLTPYSLDEVIVTATGSQAKREVGNAVSTVDVAPLVQNAPIANMSDLLAARAPGVVVLPGNMTGAGGRVRVRGNSSLSLSNNPIYVVDGIRYVSDVGSASIGTGGTNPSRLNDLNPEEIESIDVVRGPSASTLYGTDAANGVVVIKTKRGRAGRPVWNAYAEQGLIEDRNQYPSSYRSWRTGTTNSTNSTTSNTTQCFLSQVIAGVCVQDSVTSYNVWENPEASVLGTGYRNQVGLQVAGGSDAVQYFLSSEWERETGVYELPPVFRSRLLEARNLEEPRSEWERPNALRKVSVRGNISANLGAKADVHVSSGFVSSRLRRPQTDNNALGVGSNAFGGVGYHTNMISHGGVVMNNFGYRQSTPDEIFSFTNLQDINRATSSVTANYRPTSWLAARAVVGLDFISREDTELCRKDECSPFFSTIIYGYKVHNRTNFFDYTGDLNSTASYRLGSQLTARSIAGLQYTKSNNTRNLASSENLVPGSESVSSGAIPFAGEATTTAITLGFYVEQQLAWKDRLYLTGAIRSDRNSAFGEAFDRVYYPKLALSYVISDEGFFPKGTFLNSLRLRGAYGASGRQPGANDALLFYTPTTTFVDEADTPGLVLSALGNADLKPERTQEVELGFEASMLNGRLNTEFTFYNKNSRDALISRIIAPSVGAATSRFENIGEVRNRGIEASINALLVESRNLGWEFTASGSYNRNKITSLGGNPPNRGTTTSDIEGYPIQAWWMRPFTFEDTNGDGLIALSELTVGDTAVYIGPSQPVAELTAFTAVELFNRRLRIQGTADSWLGGYQLNGNERIRCQSRGNCRGTNDPTAPLEEQARAMAVRVHSSATQYGYAEKTDFLRFRELSATVSLPDRFAGLFRASRMSFTAAARNLGTITGYSGLDPQSGYFGADIGVVSDFQTQPPPTYYTFRLNVTF